MRFLLALLLVAPVCAEPSQEMHAKLVQRFFPDPTLAKQIADDSWPWVRHFSPLWAALEHKRGAELRRYYMGIVYGSAPGASFCGYRPPEQLVAPVARPVLPPCVLDGGELDCIIVGSGPAGSVLGHQLVAAGWKVALLEQGPLVLPGTTDTRQVAALKEHGGARPTADGSVLIRTAQAVGGGSTVNIDLALSPTLPFVRERLQRWQQRGLFPFDSPAMARADAWVQQRLGTRQVPPEERNANNLVLWRGAKALGLQPRLFALNTYAPRTSPWPTTDKRSSVECLLLPAMQKGLTVLPDTRADRVVFEGKRAVGVEAVFGEPWNRELAWADPWGLGLAPGTRRLLRAKRVVLCAGAQGSAALLLGSGVNDVPVGKGVILHPVVPLVARMPGQIRNELGTPSSVYVAAPGLIYECSSGEPAYVAQAIWGSPAQTREVMRSYPRMAGFGVMLVDEPQAQNRVALEDGKAVVHYRLAGQDAARMRTGVERAVRLLFAAGAEEVYLPTDELPWRIRSPRSLQKWRFQAGHTLLTSAHMQATCKIGSVVDRDGKVLTRENLYVVDSSIFPESIGANPMQTIYATAYLFAEKWVTERLQARKVNVTPPG